MKTFIVVGAGILGSATAYHLVKAGANVMIIDREDNGKGTDAAAGIVCPWLSQRRNQAWYQLAKGGAKYYPDLINQLEADGQTETGYAKVGAVSLHTDEAKLDKMEERVRKRREDAPEIGEITRLTPAETKALFPPLADEYGSVHVSGAARVNGRALCNALINAAKKRGATYIKGDAKLIHKGSHVIGVEVNDKSYYADQVIVTTGAWANELCKPLGIDFLIEPQKAQIVHLELPETNTDKWPVVMPPTNQYLLAFEGSRVVVGATHEDNVGYDTRVTVRGMHEIFDKALMVAPGLANSTVLETKVGFRPVAPGFLPVIGAIPNFQGILVANGLGASGLTVGPYVGAELAKLALGEETNIDLKLYDVGGAIHINEDV
ncbi:NAD(P)/FAD-dependent oxidoreductase [Halalkalibacter okhensis]|uniref:Oxidoreductase n=1 Tax=Halalkalibacter okhensis TaxID=333138 RepID=A0A0B0IFV6_9BACI|nr:FAD-dependent oxidoreductase [Halalkalibacter okhensis]KHF40190.1 oxidoreductase [Halalkalibacter okhensis]